MQQMFAIVGDIFEVILRQFFDLYTALCWPALWAAAILVSVSFHGKCSVLASVASLACVAS